MNHAIQITKYDHEGRGIAKINNKIIFVPNTCINDVINVRIIKEYPKYYLGGIVNYIEENPSKIKPQCPYYNDCGGCNISIMNYQDQLKFKQEKLANIFNHNLNINIPINITPSSESYHYRNKITLHVQNGILGLYREETHNLIPIDKCLLVSDNVNNLIKTILKDIELTTVKNIIIKEQEHKIQLIINGKIDQKQVVSKLKSQVVSIINNNQTIYGTTHLKVSINNLIFQISPQSFFQVNTNTIIKLYNQVLKYASPTKNDTIIDLYCGTGSIGLYLSKYCKQVIGIELNPQAIKDAKENARLNKITNATFIEGDVKDIINNKYQANIIIVDPPRKGLDQKTINIILTIKASKVIYVSCNPITLVRDLKQLMSTYQIIDTTGVDLFPQTSHVECVCVLNRR